MDFKPTATTPAKKGAKIKLAPKPSPTPKETVHQHSAWGGGTASFLSSSTLPIPIRENLTVLIHGLPFDLSEAEARKIANVVLALAGGLPQ